MNAAGEIASFRLHTHVHVLADCERRLAPSMIYITLVNMAKLSLAIIGASRSEPHTNHPYEKIAVPMYVCVYVAIRRSRVGLYRSNCTATRTASELNH